MGSINQFLRTAVLAIAAFGLASSALARGEAPLASVSLASLPVQAQQTMVLIKKGGPFPYKQDGGVFGNYERVLPGRERGYYREYTVRTPGARDRGARRIVAGGLPPREFFYTDDHYASFKQIDE